MPRRERRKCSVCAKTGHNKRTCPQYKELRKEEQNNTSVVTHDVTEIDDTPVATTLPKAPQTSSTQPVLVRTAREPELSRHVIDLKDADRESVLQSVEVFREKLAKAAVPETVDFAALIREKQKHQDRIGKKKAFRAAVATPAPVDVSALVPTVVVKRSALPQKTPVSQKKNARKRKQFSLPQFNIRPVAFAAVALTLLMAIPYPVFGYIQDVQADSARVVAASTHGFGALKDSTLAAFTADIDTAEQNLVEALGAFSEATNIIDDQHKALKAVATALPVLGPQLTGRETLLAAGHHMALGNTYLVKGASSAQSAADMKLTERLRVLESHLTSALVQYDAALTALASIPDSAIPKSYRAEADDARFLFATFVDDMHDLSDLIHVLRTLLGDNGFKRYLVMFQNHHELRPTGGFMGSFAVVDVQKGTLSWDIPGGGTYDLQGQLTLNYEPPLPLQIMNGKWEFQDANWWSHVPASAAVIEDMYENARGASIDGVLFVNATLLERLVGILGSIDHAAFATTADESTILSNIEIAKKTYQPEANKPKAVLGELVPVLFTALESVGNDGLLKLLVETQRALTEKELQLYVDDSDTQTILREYGWTGEIAVTEPRQDYLHIVRTNLQGQKSDAHIEESLHLETEIGTDGSLINTLTITRSHTGTPGVPLYGATNISYIRTYVPEGSELLSATGFEFPPEEAFKVPSRFAESHPLVEALSTQQEIDTKSGTSIATAFDKTVFGNWMIVEPGSTETVTIRYRLPFRLQSQLIEEMTAGLPYTLLLQKQSGITSAFTHDVRFPEVWDVAWISDEQIKVGGNFTTLATQLNSDYYYGMVFRTDN